MGWSSTRIATIRRQQLPAFVRLRQQIWSLNPPPRHWHRAGPLRAEWKGIRPDYAAQYWLLFVRILNCRPRPVKSLSDKWLECRYKPQKSDRGATIPKWFARVVMMGKYFLWLPQLWTSGPPRHRHRVVERFLSWLMLPQFDMKTIRRRSAAWGMGQLHLLYWNRWRMGAKEGENITSIQLSYHSAGGRT